MCVCVRVAVAVLSARISRFERSVVLYTGVIPGGADACAFHAQIFVNVQSKMFDT